MSSYEDGYSEGRTCYRHSVAFRSWFREYDYARTKGYAQFLFEKTDTPYSPVDWCDGFVRGWKEADQIPAPRERSTIETKSFVRGVQAGYHFFGESNASYRTRLEADNYEELLQCIRRKLAEQKEVVIACEWCDGFLAGWRVSHANYEKYQRQAKERISREDDDEDEE